MLPELYGYTSVPDGSDEVQAYLDKVFRHLKDKELFMIRQIENTLLPGGGIHHVAVRTTNLEASLALYRDVLGMRVVKENHVPGKHLVLLDTGNGSHIELALPMDSTAADNVPEVNHPLQHIALSTSDVHGVIERVRGAGYEITVEPRPVHLGASPTTIAFFKGASGELIELYGSLKEGE
jgi:glyoxylase I family protein